MRYALLLLTCFLPSCNSHKTLNRQESSEPSREFISSDELNALMKDQDITIWCADGRKLEGRNAFMKNSALFYHSIENVNLKIPISDLRRITWTNRSTGMKTGFLYGGAAGGLLTIPIILEIKGDRPWEAVPVGILCYGLIGGLFGLVTGYYYSIDVNGP